MNEIFKKDYYAFYGESWRIRGGEKRLISNRDIRYIYAGRMSTSAKNVFVRMFFHFIRHSMAVKRCAEISFQNVGAGFHLSHGAAIIITAKAKIGENCSLRNGITIGVELRGKRKGAPTIGDRVWIGPNATIVGKISVGNDVLIGANSYVNFDVPDHSIVIGNPGKIIYKENATEGYIVHKITECIH